ncbi:MAG TPA: hypothetical protein VGI54_06095, partial [Solirubrobacteraceae bacterium]
MPDRPGVRLTGRLALLVASMRAGGVRAGMGELLAAHRALAAVDPTSRKESYFALRAALCSRHDDLEVFDAAFDAVFGAEPMSLAEQTMAEAGQFVLPKVRVPSENTPPPPPAGDEDVEIEGVPAAWSQVELLKDKDFALYTDEERARARRLIMRLGTRGPTRISRR